MAKAKVERVVTEQKVDPMLVSVLKGWDFTGKQGFGMAVPDRDPISTGSLSLDLKLGGGLARDRVIEYYGKTQSMKTTMGLIAMKSYVDTFGYDRPPFIVDMERTITAKFVRGFGLDVSKIYFAQPMCAEEALEITERLLKSGSFGFGLFDSVDAMETEKELGRTLNEQSMAELPKLMSRAMRGISKIVVDMDCLMLFVNQVRASLNMYAPGDVTSGGNALPYYASQRVGFGGKPSKTNPAALDLTARPKKNKLSPLITAECNFDVIPARGVDKFLDFFNTAKEVGLLVGAGAYWRLMDENDNVMQQFKGQNEVKGWLQDKENESIFDAMVRERFAAVSGGMQVTLSEEEENSLDIVPAFVVPAVKEASKIADEAAVPAAFSTEHE
jgi:recombination protein RecA